MRHKQLSPNEWQALSAYLDNQLSERETRQLEARLQIRPELQAGLEELRQTRAMLRSLPRRRAPRNFTITPAMAEKIRPQRAPRVYPLLRLVSAFASFLLVMTVLGDVALGLTTRNLAATSAPDAQLMQAQAPASEDASAPAEEPFLEESAQSQALGAYPAPAAEAGPAEEPTPDPNALRSLGAQDQPTYTPEEIARMTAAPPGMGGGGGEGEIPSPAGTVEAEATVEAMTVPEQP